MTSNDTTSSKHSGSKNAFDPEHHIQKYGEEYRVLIVEALEFLRVRQPIWGVEINVDEYIANIIERSK